MVHALQNRRTRIDPRIWAAINDGVSEAWITKSRAGALMVTLCDLNHPCGSYNVTVPNGARIHNLRPALLYLDPRLNLDTMLVWPNGSGIVHYSRANALGPDQYVAKGRYFFSTRDRG
jgi:hypothetical protein